MEKNNKKNRGRPKNINRDEVLKIAMLTYWQNGILSTSVNQICKLANASKPAFYREFKSEDNLLREALKLYQDEVLTPLGQFISSISEIKELTPSLVQMMKEVDRPKGCLYVKASQSKHAIGPLAKSQLEECHSTSIKTYTSWFEKLRGLDKFPKDISTEFAALYLDSQINNAISMIDKGLDLKSVESILEFSLKNFYE